MLKIFNKEARNPAGYVYYAKLKKDGRNFYVIGFSRERSLQEHLVKNDNGDDKCIDKEFFFTFRNDGWNIAQYMLKALRKKRKFGKYGDDPNLPLYGKGQSNIFSYDVLGLDAELYKLSEEAEISGNDAAFGCLFVILGLVLIPFTAGISITLILFVIGFFGIFQYHAEHGKEVDSKQIPKLSPKLETLVNSLVSFRDFR